MYNCNSDFVDSYVPSYYYKSGFFLVWKPHGIASSFGKQYCFLDFLYDSIEKIDTRLGNLLLSNASIFGKKYEYGLLNRLDNDTAGFLYFATNLENYELYKKKHRAGLVNKYYVADVWGRVAWYDRLIASCIFHHKYQDDRMVVYRSEKDQNRIRGREHRVETYCSVLSVDDSQSSLLITIRHGIRHQIRVHLSSLGYPIIGDSLYSKKGQSHGSHLHLWSLGFSFEI